MLQATLWLITTMPLCYNLSFVFLTVHNNHGLCCYLQILLSSYSSHHTSFQSAWQYLLATPLSLIPECLVVSILFQWHDDEHAPALGSGEGIREALGTGWPALDEYRGRWLLPNTVGPYLTDHKPPKDVRQHLGQFAHTSCTYHDYTEVIEGALQCSITGSGSDSLFGRHYLDPVSSYLLSSWLPHVWSNVILHHCLAIQVIHLLFISFHWFSSAPTCYLHSDDGYQMFRISSSLIRLLPYCLQSPYGHSPCLLIFTVWYVSASVQYLLSFLVWYVT